MEHWTDEEFDLMVSKLAERKQRGSAPSRTEARGRGLQVAGADPDKLLDQVRLMNAMMGGKEQVR